MTRDDSEKVRVREDHAGGRPPAGGRLSQAPVPARQVRPVRRLQWSLPHGINSGADQEPILSQWNNETTLY